MTVRRALPTALLAAAAAAAASALPAQAQDAAPTRLWATVNVCDTTGMPNTVGVRASMPGTGNARQRMFMRFALEYRDGATWRSVGSTADSGFVALGSARFAARRTGRSFVVPPPAGGSYELRGRVTFEWRRGDRVVRRLVRRTSAGHPTGAGDPAGFSAATCRVAD